MFLFVTAKFVSNYEYNTILETELSEPIVKAKEYVQNAFSVFLYGNPGEGKTTTAFRIVKDLVENNVVNLQRCVLLRKPEDLLLVRKPEDLLFVRKDQVDLILIDDMFGKHNSDTSDFSSWDFQHLESLVGTHEIRLIMCSRKHIYKDYKKKLDGFDIFSRTTELSSATLSHAERRRILIRQLEFHKKNVNDVNVDECITQEVVGFPLCAHQFASDDLLFSKKADYFRKPYRYFLEQNIQVLDDKSLIALLYVFYKRNKLHVRDLDITQVSEETKNLLVHIAMLCGVEKSPARIFKETKDKVTSMKNSYVKCIDDEVSYFYDTMYEVVAKLHFKEFPSEVIKYCTVDYLCQCVYLDEHNQEGITVDKAQIKSFCERCVEEIATIWEASRWRGSAFGTLVKRLIFQHSGSTSDLAHAEPTNEVVYQLFLRRFFHIDMLYPHNEKPYFGMWLSNETLLKEIMLSLDCSHRGRGFFEECWKCPLKTEMLIAICYYNRLDLYNSLKCCNVPLSALCLYKAMMNQNIDSDFVTHLIDDLSQTGLSTNEKYVLQMGLGNAMKNADSRGFDILNTGVLQPKGFICYSVVMIDTDQELQGSLLFQPLDLHLKQECNAHYTSSRLERNAADAKIKCEIITMAKTETETFKRPDIIVKGIQFLKEWFERKKEKQTSKNVDKECAKAKSVQAFESALVYFTELSMAMNDTQEKVMKEDPLPTTSLIMDLTKTGFVFYIGSEHSTVIRQRKKLWNNKYVVTSLAFMMDEHLSVQPKRLWRRLDFFKTLSRYVLCSYTQIFFT